MTVDELINDLMNLACRGKGDLIVCTTRYNSDKDCNYQDEFSYAELNGEEDEEQVVMLH